MFLLHDQEQELFQTDNSPVPSTRKLNVTAAVYRTQTNSSHRANARVVAKYRYSTDVFRSWCSSNSWISICCAFEARIVAKPCSVALVWVNIGLRAV